MVLLYYNTNGDGSFEVYRPEDNSKEIGTQENFNLWFYKNRSNRSFYRILSFGPETLIGTR